jgi:hypothetical protein
MRLLGIEGRIKMKRILKKPDRRAWNGLIWLSIGMIIIIIIFINPLPPNDIYIYIYICCTAPLTSRRCILNIYSKNIHTEYFKRAA